MGGGLLRRTSDTATDDGVMIFPGGKDSDGNDTRWLRDLNGGTLDAYMAGAYGDGRLTADGKLDLASGHDDTKAIQNLLEFYKSSKNASTSNVTLHIRIGDGVFRVGTSTETGFEGKGLNLTAFPGNPRGWVIDGTGATLLGGCKDVPVVAATHSRFGTLLNLQIIGAVPDGMPADHYPSCGLRIGRKADNAAANQMTTDHLGIRGIFKIAACLNVSSEQFSDLNCEFSNDKEGDAYGFAGDAYNMLQWTRPVAYASIQQQGGTYAVTGGIVPGVTAGDLAARQFGNTGSQDKLLMSSGTGDSLCALANTDLGWTPRRWPSPPAWQRSAAG